MNSDLQNLTVRYLEAREAVKSVFRMESEYSFPGKSVVFFFLTETTVAPVRL